jgi:hypothetical protein
VTATITQEHRTRMQEAKRLSLNVSQLIQDARLDVGPAQESAIAKRLSDMPETCRRTYLRAMQGRSLAAAVKAFCMECVSWDRREVALCTAPACPLYPYRPFGRQRGTGGKGPEGQDTE